MLTPRPGAKEANIATLQTSCHALHPLVLARIHRDAAHLQALGPRAVAEALIEIATSRHDPAEMLDLLSRYSRISRTQLALAGANRPLPRQLMVVP